jgi:hypothetical protein
MDVERRGRGTLLREAMWKWIRKPVVEARGFSSRLEGERK